jgi:hypothetical protein
MGTFLIFQSPFTEGRKQKKAKLPDKTFGMRFLGHRAQDCQSKRLGGT